MPDADPCIRRYALDGSEEAFAEFVRQTARPLHRFLARLLGASDPALIEELAQRTYIAAARKAGSYRGPSATAWLLGFAFREVRTHRREVCRQRAKEVVMPVEELSLFEDAVDRRAPDPREAVEEKERAAKLRAALDGLDLPERLALELVHLEGLAYADAAQVLSIPAGTIKSRVHRAIEVLRRRLGAAEAAPCLALLAPQWAADFGPTAPADLVERTAAWTRGALEGGASGGSWAVASGAPATSAGAAEGAGRAALVSSLSAKLWFAAGLVVLATASVLFWQVQGDRGSAEAPRDQGGVATKAGEESATGEAPKAPAPAAEKAVVEAPAPPSAPEKKHYLWARGIVLDGRGSPMEGVDLRVDHAWDSLSHFPGDPAQVAVWIGGHSGPSRTGPDGRFEVPFLEKSPSGTLIGDYERIAAKEHFLHLIAKAPDGRSQIVRLRTRPADPPEVEISFTRSGTIRGMIVRAPGVPPLESAAVTAVFHDARPGRYDYFSRSDPGSSAQFEMEDLEPGRWIIYPVHLPQSAVLTSPENPEVEVGPGATAEVRIEVGPSAGLSGRIASRNGFGVGGGFLRLLDEAGSEVESVALEPTRLARDATTGEPARKAFMGATAIDLAAAPTPFRFAAARSGKEYWIALDGPDKAPLERFGPFTAPAADLELRSRTFEPDAAVLLVVEGIDLSRARDGRAYLFAGEKGVGEAWLDHGDGRGRPPSSLAFAGLAPGRYTLHVTMKEAWNVNNYFRGATTFDLGPHAEKPVAVKMGGTARVEVIQDPGLRTLRAERGSSSWRQFTAIPLSGPLLVDGASPEPASPIVVEAFEDGEGKLRFGLPPGSYAIHIPVDGASESGAPHRLGGLFRVTVEPEAGVEVEEPPPAGGKLSVVVADALLEACTLAIEGEAAEGLPVKIERLAPGRGRFEILHLPAGTYRLILIGPGRSGASGERQLRFEGRDLEIEWAGSGN